MRERSGSICAEKFPQIGLLWKFFKHMKRVLLFITLLGVAILSKAADYCLVHLNKSFYVSGEIVWYKAYLPDAFKGEDLMLHVQVIREQELEEEHYQKTEGKSWVSGYYKIPYQASSGVYQLVLSAINSKDKTRFPIASVSLPIYNDLESLAGKPLVQELIREKRPQSIPGEQKLKIQIRLDQESHSRRGLIMGKILVNNSEGLPEQAHISMSVLDRTWIPASATFNAISIKRAAISREAVAEFSRKRQLSGRVLNPDGQAIRSSVLGLYDTQQGQFSYASSGENLEFSFELDAFYGTKSVQFIDYQRDHIKIDLSNDIPEVPKQELIYSKKILDYLHWSRQRKKIYQLYATVETQLELAEYPAAEAHFEPDDVYVIPEYEQFPDLPTFFKEVATTFKFRKKKDGIYFAKMFDATPDVRTFYPDKPLIMIDGKLTRDAHFLANIPLEQIQEVQCFYKIKGLRRQFGPMGNNGLAIFTTKQGSIRLPDIEEQTIFKIKGLQKEGQFPAMPDAPVEWQPIFRPQIYWKPDLGTTEQGAATFSFHHTDDLGTFQIEVLVQTESGKMGRAVLEYQVRD